MPLSDRERQILADIEARLREDDPKFARTVATETISTQLQRRVKFAAVGFVLGLLVMLALIVHLAYGIAGFAIMLASAVYGGNALVRMGHGQGRVGEQLRGGMNRYFSEREDEGR